MEDCLMTVNVTTVNVPWVFDDEGYGRCGVPVRLDVLIKGPDGLTIYTGHDGDAVSGLLWVVF